MHRLLLMQVQELAWQDWFLQVGGKDIMSHYGVTAVSWVLVATRSEAEPGSVYATQQTKSSCFARFVKGGEGAYPSWRTLPGRPLSLLTSSIL